MGRPDANLGSSARSPPGIDLQVEPNDPMHQQQLHQVQNLQETPVDSAQAANIPAQNPQANVVHPGSGLNQTTTTNYVPPPAQNSAQGYPQSQSYVQAPPQYVQYVPGNYVAHANAMPVYNNMAAAPQAPVQVVAGAAVGAVQNLPQISRWETGLLDCMDDPFNALITCCFPCVTFGQVAEILDQGNTSCATSAFLYGCVAFLIGCPCLISCTYRTKLRSKFNLIETPAPDWLTHCLCECCAICQEYRELQRRGLDPSIGWHANLAKNPPLTQCQIAMVPPMHQNMRG